MFRFGFFQSIGSWKRHEGVSKCPKCRVHSANGRRLAPKSEAGAGHGPLLTFLLEFLEAFDARPFLQDGCRLTRRYLECLCTFLLCKLKTCIQVTGLHHFVAHAHMPSVSAPAPVPVPVPVCVCLSSILLLFWDLPTHFCVHLLRFPFFVLRVVAVAAAARLLSSRPQLIFPPVLFLRLLTQLQKQTCGRSRGGRRGFCPTLEGRAAAAASAGVGGPPSGFSEMGSWSRWTCGLLVRSGGCWEAGDFDRTRTQVGIASVQPGETFSCLIAAEGKKRHRGGVGVGAPWGSPTFNTVYKCKKKLVITERSSESRMAMRSSLELLSY